VSEYLALDHRYDDIKIIGTHHGGDVRHPTAPPIFDPSLRRLACGIAVNYIIDTIYVISRSFSHFCRRHLRRLSNTISPQHLMDDDHWPATAAAAYYGSIVGVKLALIMTEYSY
jgi:hypothetical protein